MEKEMITMNEAAELLGVSRMKMRQLVGEHGLTAFANPLDKRQKLFRMEDVTRLRQVKPKSNVA